MSITILDDDILEENEEFIILAQGNSPVNVIDGEITFIIVEDPLDCE